MSCFSTLSCQGLAMASTWSLTQLLCRPSIALGAFCRAGFSCEQFLPPSHRHWTSSLTRKLHGPDMLWSCGINRGGMCCCDASTWLCCGMHARQLLGGAGSPSAVGLTGPLLERSCCMQAGWSLQKRTMVAHDLVELWTDVSGACCWWCEPPAAAVASPLSGSC